MNVYNCFIHNCPKVEAINMLFSRLMDKQTAVNLLQWNVTVIPQKHWVNLAPSSCFLIPFPNKKNQSSLQKCLMLGLRQETYKMSLEPLTVIESRKYFKKKAHNNCDVSKEHRGQLRMFLMAKDGTIWTTKYNILIITQNTKKNNHLLFIQYFNKILNK